MCHLLVLFLLFFPYIFIISIEVLFHFNYYLFIYLLIVEYCCYTRRRPALYIARIISLRKRAWLGHVLRTDNLLELSVEGRMSLKSEWVEIGQA